MLVTNTNMSVQEELTNVDAALATNPDALILTIPDNNAFTKVVADARAKGSPRSLSSSLRSSLPLTSKIARLGAHQHHAASRSGAAIVAAPASASLTRTFRDRPLFGSFRQTYQA
jgi:ABC-type sugar transport system substrate-binding protein